MKKKTKNIPLKEDEIMDQEIDPIETDVPTAPLKDFIPDDLAGEFKDLDNAIKTAFEGKVRITKSDLRRLIREAIKNSF